MNESAKGWLLLVFAGALFTTALVPLYDWKQFLAHNCATFCWMWVTLERLFGTRMAVYASSLTWMSLALLAAYAGVMLLRKGRKEDLH
jgi:hypothetical protein